VPPRATDVLIAGTAAGVAAGGALHRGGKQPY
jgi:hypothetical protein